MITEMDVGGILKIQGLSPAHLERRKKYVTASEMPAICGLDDYRGPVDLWLEKTGQAPPSESSEPAAIGTAMESGLQTLVEAATGWTLSKSGAWNVYKGFIGATLDWRASQATDESCFEPRGIVQGKTGGMKTADEYKTEPPPRVLVQVQTEMLCAEEDSATVAALLGGFGPLKFRMFRVGRDEEMIKGLIEVAAVFHECVKTGKRPEGVARLETLKRIVREPGKVVAITNHAIADYEVARTSRLMADKESARLKEIEQRMAASIIQIDPAGEWFESPTMGALIRTSVDVKSYTVNARTDERITFKTAEQLAKPSKAPKAASTKHLDKLAGGA